METPSSTTRRVTRSQTTLAASHNTNSSSNNIPVSRKAEDSEENLSKTRQRNGQKQQDRSALVDITNDSPIVGVANGDGGDLETPLSSITKQRGSRVKNTPGSGEALLRGQVKTLLQKVEEEAEISKLSIEIRPFHQLVNSPMGLLAPTPANTPQIPNLSGDGGLNNSATGLVSVSPSPVVEEQLISRVVNQIFDGKNKEDPESEKSLISRSLLLDFSDKSEISECTFGVTYQEQVVQEVSSSYKEDDVASIWSLQVNASTHDEEDDDDDEIAEKEEAEKEDYYQDVEEEEEYDDGGLLLDELCAGLNNISVNGRVASKFAGKHTRFVYNSDDELVEEIEVEVKHCDEIDSDSSSNILRLKGLPTPKGKHLRFPEEEEKSAM